MVKRINVKLILELKASGLSQNTIVATRHISKNSVSTVVGIAKEKGLSYDDIKEMNDDDLYKLFFPDKVSTEQIYQLPDYEYIHEELKKVGVTLKLLHKEYCDKCKVNRTIAVGYSKFCDDYGTYISKRDITNHLEHKPGQRCEVDWSGPTMKIVTNTGEVITVYLFVSCLTYSRYAYVEPTLDMKMDTWLRCHIHMYNYFGGVPVRTVCDNLKTGVVKHPKEGEIILTDSYESLGTHYVTAIMPAGVRKPKQKASCENTVGNIATAIIAKLRHQTFYDFPSLQTAVKKTLKEYNEEPFQKREYSRQVVHTEEKKYLRPLPVIEYEVATWEYGRKVYSNCHVSLLKNYYSVPYIYRGSKVDIKYTESVVEIYHDHQRIAIHPKFPDYMENHYETTKSDLPDEFNNPEMNDERMRSWASIIGPNTLDVINRIFNSVQLKEQGYNAALSILNLSKQYPKERFESVCSIALSRVSSPRYKYLKALLTNNQDLVFKEHQTKKQHAEDQVPFQEDSGAFIRGAGYYGGIDYDK
jgi:transposase